MFQIFLLPYYSLDSQLLGILVEAVLLFWIQYIFFFLDEVEILFQRKNLYNMFLSIQGVMFFHLSFSLKAFNLKFVALLSPHTFS